MKKWLAFFAIFFAVFCTYHLTCFFYGIFYGNKPVIDHIEQSQIVKQTMIDGGLQLNVKGRNLSNVIGIYMNNSWDADVHVQYVSDEELLLLLPSKYYQKEGTLNIKLEKKINSDQTVFSNAVDISVISEDVVKKPLIKATQPQNLKLDCTGQKILQIQGENFKNGCKIIIDDKEYDTHYVDESCLEIVFPYSEWCRKESLAIKVSQTSTDGTVYHTVSDTYRINVQGNRNYNLNYDWIEKNRYVAHGFGEYRGKTYTNSLEAFHESYRKGYRVFEVDLAFTSDHVLMLKHDWGKGWLEDTNLDNSKINNLPKTFEEIKNAVEGYTLLSFDDLCQIMNQYKDIYIVTDSKETGSSGIDAVFQYMVKHASMFDEPVLDRLIVQIYNEQMYYELMNIYHFKSIIYTLYYNNDSEEDVIEFVKKTGIKVVTMYEEKMTESFIHGLTDLNVYVYVHTINDTDTAIKLLQDGAYGFYTDSLFQKDTSWMDEERDKYFQRLKLKSAESMTAFMKALRGCNGMTTIVAIRNDSSSEVAIQMQKFLYQLGARETIPVGEDSAYIFVVSNENVIYEKKTEKKLIKYAGKIGNSNISIITGGGYDEERSSNININGMEYSPNQTGVNVVVYDTANQKACDIISCEIDGKSNFVRYDIEKMESVKQTEENLEFMLAYLKELQSERYIILFSVNDDAQINCTDEIKETLKNLGCSREFEMQHGFAAIVNGSECIFSASSEDPVVYDDFIEGRHIYIESRGHHAGCYASIRISDVEYSRNSRGLNIVVYDKLCDKVIDSITFDLFDQYKHNYGESEMG
ncbi:MAG: hypothetical protein HFH35_13485 [Eubacterium sp.]|nr:hypothetical protein [Eubacterium sp.]